MNLPQRDGRVTLNIYFSYIFFISIYRESVLSLCGGGGRMMIRSVKMRNFEFHEEKVKMPPVTMPERLFCIMDDYCKTKGYQRSEFIRMLIRDFLKKEGWLK
jgi:hypothetical protein